MRVAAEMVRVLAVVAVAGVPILAQEPAAPTSRTTELAVDDPAARLAQGYDVFYNGNYDQAAAIASALLTVSPDTLDALELRTSAILFRLKAIIGDAKNKDKAVKACAIWIPCVLSLPVRV